MSKRPECPWQHSVTRGQDAGGSGKLRADDQDRRPRGEAVEHGSRHHVRDPPALERAHQDAGDTHYQGQKRRQAHVVGRARRGQGNEGPQREQGRHRHGTGLEVRRRSEERGRKGRHGGREEPMPAGKTRQLRVRHGLGNEHQSHAEARHEVPRGRPLDSLQAGTPRSARASRPNLSRDKKGRIDELVMVAPSASDAIPSSRTGGRFHTFPTS